VTLTSEGFAISGGALYEPEPGRFKNKCETCFQENPELANYRRCEVYSRVVGYLRPVAQWNAGKQAEFKDRRACRP
jgi:anaerobic ribonucleoside-triphosphate reductase